MAWAPHIHIEHVISQASAVFFCLLANGASTKPGECGALMVTGHISIFRYRIRPLPAAPLAVRRRYLIVGPMPMSVVPRKYLKVLSAQAVARGAV